MEYQYQAKGKPSEKRAANEISRKLAYLSSSRINFVALMSSAPLLRGRGRLKHYFALYGGTTTQDPFLLSYSYYFKTFLPPRPKSPKTFFLWDLPWDLAHLFTSGLVPRPLEFLPRPPMQQNNTKYKYKQKFKHKQKQRSKINAQKSTNTNSDSGLLLRPLEFLPRPSM